jgi:predicted nucleic acid-binding protein
MKRVFVDTGGFFALLVPEDVAFPRGRELFRRAEAERWRLVTTNVVVIETYSLLLARSRGGRRNAIEFLDMVTSDEYQLERIRKADEERAAALVRAHEDKSYSLCDALSFVVMERLRINEAIAFDRHFREYGRFTIL